MLEKLFHPTVMVYFHAEIEHAYQYTVFLVAEMYMMFSEY